MNYPLRNNNSSARRRNLRQKNLTIIAVIIIVALLMISAPIKKTLFSIANPFWTFENYLLEFFANNIELIRSKKALITERQNMERRIFESGDLMALNSILKTENEELKDLLGRKTITQQTVLATVLVKPPQNLYDILIIDVGINQGVKVGDKVIADANIYLGEISEVYDNTAKVTLYSSPGKKLPVTLGTNSISAEAVGMGGGNFSIFLPSEIEVRENDVIVIPSITPNVFGIVEKINFQDKDAFQTVLFKSPVNISELAWVEVIL